MGGNGNGPQVTLSPQHLAIFRPLLLKMIGPFDKFFDFSWHRDTHQSTRLSKAHVWIVAVICNFDLMWGFCPETGNEKPRKYRFFDPFLFFSIFPAISKTSSGIYSPKRVE